MNPLLDALEGKGVAYQPEGTAVANTQMTQFVDSPWHQLLQQPGLAKPISPFVMNFPGMPPQQPRMP